MATSGGQQGPPASLMVAPLRLGMAPPWLWLTGLVSWCSVTCKVRLPEFSLAFLPT